MLLLIDVHNTILQPTTYIHTYITVHQSLSLSHTEARTHHYIYQTVSSIDRPWTCMMATDTEMSKPAELIFWVVLFAQWCITERAKVFKPLPNNSLKLLKDHDL